MGTFGPRKIYRYSKQFKATAVRLSQLPDVLVQDVADALDIHPFMLSRWRRLAREEVLMTKGVKLDVETAAELKRLRQVEKEYAIFKEEHALLKSHPVCFVSKAEVFACIEANGDAHAVALKGESPAKVPFEYPTHFELGINLRTARTLGIAVPQSILHRAERLIR